MIINESHIGWAVNSIEDAIEKFTFLGYTVQRNICIDHIRKVKLALLNDVEGHVIELVAPIAEDSPVSDLLQKVGPTPYHICFTVNKSDWEIYKKTLKANGFVILHKPSPAPLFDGKKVVFLYSKDIGLVELVLDDDSNGKEE